MSSPQITLTIDTCPFRAAEAFAATIITRNITIESLPAGYGGGSSGNATVPGATAAAAPTAGSGGGQIYEFNCNLLTDRFQLQTGYQVTLSNLLLLNCRTYSYFGFLRKAAGSVVVYDHIIENLGSVCLPQLTAQGIIAGAERPPGAPPLQQQMHQPAANSSSSNGQQAVQLTAASSNWCAGAAAGRTGSSSSSTLSFPFPPLLPPNSSSELCSQQALLLGDIAIPETATNTSTGTRGAAFTLRATNSAAICPQPVSPECVRELGVSACLSSAYDEVNPDKRAPCIAPDAAMLLRCLGMQNYSSVVVLQTATMGLSSAPAQQQPLLISRNVTVMSDPSSEAGAAVQEREEAAHVNGSASASDNSSYSTIRVTTDNLGLFANTTGMGPAFAATLPEPAAAPYYAHSSWPDAALCNEASLILRDYAAAEPYGWVAAANAPTSAAAAAAAAAASGGASSSPQQQQKRAAVYGSEVDTLNGSYSGTFLIRYANSSLLCTQPTAAADCPGQDPGNATACVAAAYQRRNPDRLLEPGAAAYAAAGARWREQQSGRSYGVTVVLPAVLASVLGAAALAALVAALFIRRRRRGRKSSSHTKSTHDTWLPNFASGGGAAAASSAGRSSDPARQLLGVHSTPGAASSGDAARSPRDDVISLPPHVAPDGITLNLLMGVGSFGRVYSATWNNAPVAVKVITHSSADEPRISQELALSLSFDHPNLVRALHFAKLRINPGSDIASLVGRTSARLAVPAEGAVGVFTLPQDWAVAHTARQGQQLTSNVDSETWIVMDLMNGGNLAAAVRHRSMFIDGDGSLSVVRLLRRAADVAAGVSYLHSRNVCHGDLKCENVLLRSEPQDPDGCMAKVADFGLSRALAYGQSHLSTRRYGTVTHMPPELLVAGKLTPAADVYSFGIMMWELVSRQLPFAGLHHGEVIHRVVTQDLRPGPWPGQARLPRGYVALGEACWARRAGDRPGMAQVLQALLGMLAAAQQQQLQQQG
ncbi:hypothetical protein COO60DRAFT_1693831 [Scenedesmus sp. NREL 46B-D3]|nr:hypothetical protein COO60DRAFT_1693831 [Scenedesmus sp. NREL 46B-D3]